VASYAQSLVLFRGPLLKALLNAGHEVIAMAPDEDPKTTHTLSQYGAMFISIPLSRTGINPLGDMVTFSSLRATLRRYRPDIVLSYTVKPVIYASMAAKSVGVGSVFSIVTGLGYAFIEVDGQVGIKRTIIGGIVDQLYRTALRTNTRVMFQNPDDRDLFVKRGIVAIGKCQIINGSGVDTNHYAESPVEAHGHLTFLLIARLLGDKGIREYVAAARIIKARYPDSVFWLLGPSDPNPAAIPIDELDTWQREGVIEYLGKTDDVRPFLAKTSVYVLPSYREGTPRTVLEAMAMGRPIITTDAPGCRETVVEGENGFLVPVRNAQALAKAMEKFIHQPELIAIMGKRSREIAVEKYDVHNVNRAIMTTMGLVE
jgi:glycosyltransferase involved in cell wall biosynthesis